MAFWIPVNPAMDTTNKFMGGLSTIPSSPSPTGGGIMPPTPSTTPLPATPKPPVGTTNGTRTGIIDSIIPKANASDSQPNLIQQYLDDPKQDLWTKKEIMRAIQNGDEDSIMKSLQDGGYKGTIATTETPTPTKTEESGIMSKIGGAIQAVGQPIQNVVWGAISEIPQIAGNVLWLASDVGWFVRWQSKEEREAASNIAKWLWKSGKEFVQKYGAYQPESTAAKVWETAADIWASMAVPGWVLKSGVWLAENIARWAVQWAIEMGKYTWVSEGRLPTAWEAGAWALLWGAIPAVWAGLSKAKSALQLSGLVTPAKLDLVKNMIKEEWSKTPDNVSKWMQDRNIWGTKESIIKQLDAVSDASKSAVDTSLASVKKTYDLPVAKQAVNQLFDKISEVPGLEKETAKIVEQFGKKELTLSELNALKRQIDNTYDIYKASSYGDPKAGLVAKGLNNMRTEIKTFIETQAKKEGLPSIADLNNQTAVAKALSINIGKKESSEMARELISMFAPTGVWAGLGAVGWAYSGDPYWALKWAIAGWLAGSTFLKTGAAKILNALDPSETAIVKKFIDSRGTTDIPEGIMQKIKSLSSNKTKNAISNNISDSVGSGVNPLDLSKNKKGMINPKAIGENLWVIPLVEEAKKYKSAEEFINNQPIFFTWRSKKYDNIHDVRWENIFFTKNPKVAEYYWWTMENVSEWYIDTSKFLDLSSKEKKIKFAKENLTNEDVKKLFPNIEFRNWKLPLTWETSNEFYSRHLNDLINNNFTGWKEQKILLDNIKKKWYGWVILGDAHFNIPWDHTSYVVLDRNLMKTKAQLIDIYNKANKEDLWVIPQKFKVFHGSNMEFDQFDPNRINTVEPWWDFGGKWYYFADSADTAWKYAWQAVKRKWWTPTVMQFEISMKKPYVINSAEDASKLRDLFGGEEKYYDLKESNPQKIQDKLKSLWYDGIIDNIYWQKAVFDTSQIKKIKSK